MELPCNWRRKNRNLYDGKRGEGGRAERRKGGRAEKAKGAKEAEGAE
jgi:hypothetical protein